MSIYSYRFLSFDSVAKRDLFTENERMEREISSLKLQIENLKKDLQQTEMDQDGKVNPAMKENLQSLLAENRRLVQDFKSTLMNFVT